MGWEYADTVDLPICNVTRIKCYLKGRGTALLKCRKQKLCPIECVQSKYEIRSYTHNIRHDIVTDRAIKLPGWTLNESKTEDYIKKNIIGIQIEFSKSAKVEELVPAVDWNILVGTIGGSIGLAMGFSIITCFEFIFFIYDYIRYTLLMWKEIRLKVTTLHQKNEIHVNEHYTFTNGDLGTRDLGMRDLGTKVMELHSG